MVHFCLVTLPVAVQPTNDIMLLSGGKLRQATYNQQDSRLISKHLETALIYDSYVCRTCSSLKLFDLHSESGHLLYQILFKCDLPGEGIYHIKQYWPTQSSLNTLREILA